jgi:hypothetical protein
LPGLFGFHLFLFDLVLVDGDGDVGGDLGEEGLLLSVGHQPRRQGNGHDAVNAVAVFQPADVGAILAGSVRGHAARAIVAAAAGELNAGRSQRFGDAGGSAADAEVVPEGLQVLLLGGG